MGENSKIEWTHHTFNPWLGCTKVSPACQHCYAEAWAKRTGIVTWGDSAERRRTTESYWRQPLKWNSEALNAREQRRVFCASLADVFEDRPELKLWRKDLIALIRQTPNLDWLLLTKRPQNILRLMREAAPRGADRELRSHLYLGTTVESQDQVRRIEYLLNCRAWARVLFLSVEPMLGPLDLFPWLHAVDGGQGFDYNAGIDWVICGGESGGGARPMSPEWVYDLRDQCEEADVPFHFKQWGEWFPREEWEHNPELCLPDDHDAYIEDRHTRVFKHGINEYFPVHRVGKKAAGRLLGGRTWDEFPKMAQRSTVTDRASRRLGSQAVESQDVLGLKLT